MAPFIPKTFLIDTGFWYAIYDKADQYHEQAIAMFSKIENSPLIVPWPTLYEVLNTSFLSEKPWIERFERFLQKPTVTKIDDSNYKEQSLIYSMAKSKEKDWNISLVDGVIRQMLADENLKIDYLVTFNNKHFNDVLKRKSTIEY